MYDFSKISKRRKSFSTVLFMSLMTFLWSTSQAAPRSMELKRSWARSLLRESTLLPLYPSTAQPQIFGDLILAASGEGDLLALKKSTGTPQWRRTFPGSVESFRLSGEDLFFGAGDGNFYRVNGQSGEVIWKTHIRSQSVTRPLVIKDRVYHLAMNGSLYCFEVSSGRILWVKSHPVRENMTIRSGTSPVEKDGTIFVGHADGYFVAHAIEKGRVLWRKRLSDEDKFNDIDSTPVFPGDDKVCVSNYNNALYCLNRKTGATLWSLSSSGGSSALKLIDGALFYSQNDIITQVDAELGKVLKAYKGDSHWGPPTSVSPMGKDLVVGYAQGPLVVFDKESGLQKEKFFSGWGVASDPLVVEHNIYFASKAANLFCLKKQAHKKSSRFHWGL